MSVTTPLTPAQSRLIRIHLALMPVYGWILLVWVSYAVDVSLPGRIDRSGHIKGHDFAHFYVLGQIANEHATADLYDFTAQGQRMDRLVPDYENRFAPIHGPQMSMLFAPLARLPYEVAWGLWIAITCAGWGICCFLLWRAAPGLQQFTWATIVLTLGYPAFYFLIAFGQSSIIALACVTAAYLALRAKRPWLAGFALGSLVYKPTFGLALPFVLLLGREWHMLAGASVAVIVQLGLAASYFGVGVLRTYLDAMVHVRDIAGVLEPIPYQMQSLRSFFSVLLPWPDVAFVAYFVAAAAGVAIAAWHWRGRAALELRYSVLLLIMILVNPHVNPYDLVAIVPAFFLIASWGLTRGAADRRLWVLLYLAYYLPGLTFIPTVTHLQVSVVALAALAAVVIRRTGTSSVGELRA